MQFYFLISCVLYHVRYQADLESFKRRRICLDILYEEALIYLYRRTISLRDIFTWTCQIERTKNRWRKQVKNAVPRLSLPLVRSIWQIGAKVSAKLTVLRYKKINIFLILWRERSVTSNIRAQCLKSSRITLISEKTQDDRKWNSIRSTRPSGNAA